MLQYFGKNSIIVLCVHPTLLLLFTYPCAGRISHWQVLMQCLMAVVVLIALIIAEIPFIQLINRYFPFLVCGKKAVMTRGD